MGSDDHELLRQYARDASQPAFAALVTRHVDLVYTAARRQVRSPQLAEEVAQLVFLDLARSAAQFKPAVPVAAWLYTVTRRTAIDVLRRESRRQAREQAAVEIAAMTNPPSSWSQIEPLLDEAMDALSAADRCAILLRYFQNKSLREVGAALGASDDAAQKRVRGAIAMQQSETQALSRELALLRRERDAAEREIDAGQRQVAERVVQADGGDAPLEAEMKAWLARVKQLKQFATQKKEFAIPEFQLLSEQDWFVACRNATFDTDGHIRQVLNELRQSAKSNLAPLLQAALRRYATEHDGLLPDNPTQLASAELPAELLARYEMVQTGKLSDAATDWLMDERSPVDPKHDRRLYVSAYGSGETTYDALRPQDLRTALEAFTSANPGHEPDTPAELAPFFRQPLGDATLKTFLQSPPEAFSKRIEPLIHPKTGQP